MKYIIMPALTSDEYEDVSFATVELTDERIAYFKKLQGIYNNLPQNENIAHLVIFSDNADFFTDNEELPEDILLDSDEDFTPVIAEIDENTFSTFSRPTETIKYGEMRVDADGITFIGNGKYSNNEYSCEFSFSLIS
jgi:hypothetical protein